MNNDNYAKLHHASTGRVATSISIRFVYILSLQLYRVFVFFFTDIYFTVCKLNQRWVTLVAPILMTFPRCSSTACGETHDKKSKQNKVYDCTEYLKFTGRRTSGAYCFCVWRKHAERCATPHVIVLSTYDDNNKKDTWLRDSNS